MSQSEGEILFWERFLTRTNFKRIIELGTYKGHFSFYLYLYCIQNKKEFYTYDNLDWKSFDKRAHLKNKLNFDKCFKKADIFEIKKEIGEIIQRQGTTIVFCDNGNKPKELKTFTLYLKKDDIIVSHDYGTEVQKTDIPNGLEIITMSQDSIFLKKV